MTHTYRKVRVYGWLRFGTEHGHSGVQRYEIAPSKTVEGHWEIHPVEKVETIDNQVPFKIGPEAKYVKPPTHGNGSLKERYKINDEHFSKENGPYAGSNYARMIGNVQTIKKSPNGSGDLDVVFEVGARPYTATIPRYYVESFNPITQTITFFKLPNFKSIKYSLRPSDTKTRTFYGLRNWTFPEGQMIPTLAPVEMIK
jgi:hypothetical protein